MKKRSSPSLLQRSLHPVRPRKRSRRQVAAANDGGAAATVSHAGGVASVLAGIGVGGQAAARPVHRRTE